MSAEDEWKQDRAKQAWLAKQSQPLGGDRAKQAWLAKQSQPLGGDRAKQAWLAKQSQPLGASRGPAAPAAPVPSWGHEVAALAEARQQVQTRRRPLC